MYFITTIDSKDGDTRCVGYYSTFEKAEGAVLDNACDIWETCYDYAVIENVGEGLYQYDQDPVWYKWDDLNEEYVKMEGRPKQYKNQIGFGIG
jgi:hypothetical protein